MFLVAFHLYFKLSQNKRILSVLNLSSILLFSKQIVLRYLNANIEHLWPCETGSSPHRCYITVRSKAICLLWFLLFYVLMFYTVFTLHCYVRFIF